MVENVLFYGYYFVFIFCVGDPLYFWKDVAWWARYMFVAYIWDFYIKSKLLNLVWCEHKHFVLLFKTF